MFKFKLAMHLEKKTWAQKKRVPQKHFYSPSLLSTLDSDFHGTRQADRWIPSFVLSQGNSKMEPRALRDAQTIDFHQGHYGRYCKRCRVFSPVERLKQMEKTTYFALQPASQGSTWFNCSCLSAFSVPTSCVHLFPAK